jgi:hypothetical protein
MIATATETKTDERGVALWRLLLVSEFLRQCAFPLETPTIQREIGERAGREWSRQTVLRDLQLLARTGAVKPVAAAHRGGAARWQWVGVRSLLEQRPGA